MKIGNFEFNVEVGLTPAEYMQLTVDQQLEYVKSMYPFKPRYELFGLPTVEAAKAGVWKDGTQMEWEKISERLYTRPYYDGEGRNTWRGVAHYTEETWKCSKGVFTFTTCED